MKISTKGRYALRIMVDIAINSKDKFVPVSDIAKRQGISNKYVENIISMLNKAGFLETKRGKEGGYRLTRAPEKYLVGDILNICEGDLSPIYCTKSDGVCERKDICKTYSFWKGLDSVINDYVYSKTLKDLMK